MSLIESTYKSKDTEETLDVLFYRPFGYLIARFAKLLNMTPNIVTFLGTVIGVIGGHLFYYNNIRLTIAGIILLIISEAFDSADGQLARMTNKFSRFGRILDGMASNFVFISAYVHVCLRLMNEGWSGWIFALAIVSGACHSIQSAIADYYRTGYLYFVISSKKGELDSASEIREKYNGLSWQKNPIQKLLLRTYLNYTNEQEYISPRFKKFAKVVNENYKGELPEELKEKYKANSKPLIKYFNILTTNTRMFFLFFVLLINIPWLYFLFELAVLNMLLVYVIIRQENICKDMLDSILKPKECLC